MSRPASTSRSGVLAAVVLTVAAAGVLGRAPSPAAPGVPRTVPVTRASVVVRPGDTLWALARRLQPHGDVRPLVDELAGRLGGRPLRAGQRVVLP